MSYVDGVGGGVGCWGMVWGVGPEMDTYIMGLRFVSSANMFVDVAECLVIS